MMGGAISKTQVLAALGQAVKDLRVARNMTQEELAWNASVTIGVISRIEGGKNDVKWSTLLRIAGALEVTAAEFAARASAGLKQPSLVKDDGGGNS